jgi:hypothetical protein
VTVLVDEQRIVNTKYKMLAIGYLVNGTHIGEMKIMYSDDVALVMASTNKSIRSSLL